MPNIYSPNSSHYTKYGNGQFTNTKKSQKKSASRPYIPSLKEINSLDQIHITDQKSLIIDDQKGNPHIYHGMEYVYKLSGFLGTSHCHPKLEGNMKSKILSRKQNKPIYICDNHNHALYYRILELEKHKLTTQVHQLQIILHHLDQHSDLVDNIHTSEFDTIYTTYIQDISGCRDLGTSGSSQDSELQKRFDIFMNDIYSYTQEKCHMGNFIKPFLHIYTDTDFTRIKSEYQLLYLLPDISHTHNSSNFVIVDIDLDFRVPEMSIENYEQTLIHTRTLINAADVVTIATSPYYMDQQLALQVLHDIFSV